MNRSWMAGLLVGLGLGLSLGACGPSAQDGLLDGGAADGQGVVSDAGDAGDAGAADAGAGDGGVADAGLDDGGSTDGGPLPPLAGFGAISGSCGVLDTELFDTGPSLIPDNHLDFGLDPYDATDFDLLSVGGQKIVTDGNAGGNSLLSELFSYEVLYRCEGALLQKTETEVLYTNPMGKITDFLVTLDGETIGVSVTRAVAFPFSDPYPVATAKTLLEKKLQGVLDSSANVAPSDQWRKQILSVIAYGPSHADAIAQAWAQVSPALKADTIVYVTETDGDDTPLY